MNFYKKLLFITLFSITPLSAQFALPDLSDDDLSSLQQDVAAIDEFIKSLPPEEQRKIEEEAFRILSEMPEEDLEQFMKLSEQITEGMQIPDQAPIQEAPETIKEPEEKVDVRAQEQEKQKKQKLRATISAIIEHIDTLISKTQSMPRISDRPNVEKRWKDQLQAVEDFRALLEHLINPVSVDKDVLISKIILEENSGYRSELNKIKGTLGRLIPTIKLPDAMGLKKADSRALRALNQLITDVENLSLQALTTKTKELITKYAPKELKKDSKDAPTRDTYSAPSRDYSSSGGDYGYRPSRGGPRGGHPDYYGGAGSYPDDFYMPPAQRTADAGRYVQRAPGTRGAAGRRQTGRPAGRRAQPATGKGLKAPTKQKGATMPGTKRAVPNKLQQQLFAQTKEFIQKLEDAQNSIISEIEGTKAIKSLLDIEQYLKASTPSEEAIHAKLDFTNYLLGDIKKLAKDLNKSIERLPKDEMIQSRETLNIILEKSALPALDKKLKAINIEDLPKSKQAYAKSIQKFTTSYAQLKNAIQGKEEKTEKKPKAAPKA